MWPATYQAPRLDATGEDVAIGSLELVCEGVEAVSDLSAWIDEGEHSE